jgi:hypothetical protein
VLAPIIRGTLNSLHQIPNPLAEYQNTVTCLKQRIKKPQSGVDVTEWAQILVTVDKIVRNPQQMRDQRNFTGCEMAQEQVRDLIESSIGHEKLNQVGNSIAIPSWNRTLEYPWFRLHLGPKTRQI